MKGRSSRQGNKGERGVAKNNLHLNNNKVREEPNLSGAYIRDLVKQLTSSRIKDPMNPNEINTLDYKNEGQRLVPPQHKKQVRRRLHTTRPYQERLLNMAEARREIVSALKLHRATMKKQAQNPEPSSDPPPLEEDSVKARRNSKSFPPNESVEYPLSQPDLSYNYSTFYPYSCSSSRPYSFWPGIRVESFHDDLTFALPSQTLGLNLNLQEFNNLDKTIYSLSYSSPKSNLVSSSEGESSGLGLHQSVDEEEMEEIKSLGQKHEVEWDDSENLGSSARWFKFPNNNSENGNGDEYSSPPFDDEVAQFPDWLNEDFEQDYVIDNCLQDPALPCLDIGEIEGLDGEWLG